MTMRVSEFISDGGEVQIDYRDDSEWPVKLQLSEPDEGMWNRIDLHLSREYALRLRDALVRALTEKQIPAGA
jgi:hypothetical protein